MTTPNMIGACFMLLLLGSFAVRVVIFFLRHLFTPVGMASYAVARRRRERRMMARGYRRY